MKYLVQWRPKYEVLGEYDDDVQFDLTPDQDWVRDVDQMFYHPKPLQIWRWMTDKEWETILRHHENGDYESIFRIHNENEYSDDFYCCHFHKKHVDYNVEVRQSTKG